MTREEKIKLLQRIESGESANVVLNADAFLFGIDGVYKYNGRILTEKEVKDWPGQVVNYVILKSDETMEEVLIKLDANNIVIPEDPEDPEEPEYPSSPYPRKEKRERITVQPEPVARSTDWCIGPDDDDYSGRKIMQIPIRL